jgi:hypothetical protein
MPFSVLMFAILLAMTAGSFVMVRLLASRWTTHRRFFTLRDWGLGHGLRMIRTVRRPGEPERSLPAVLPERIARLDPPARVRWHFTNGQLTLLRLHAPGDTWNLLLWSLAAPWPATALRPSRIDRCLLDRLELFSYPSTHGVERFTLHGTDPGAARRLNDSVARGLLPPDLTLLLDGPLMVIDFSSRPFDPIDMDRVVALARQLAAGLPPPP